MLMSPTLTPGTGGYGMDAAPQAIHYTMPKERKSRQEEPLSLFNGRIGEPNKKGRDSRNMAIFQPNPTNVEKAGTVRELSTRKEISRGLSFEKPALPDVPGMITEKVKGRAREA